MVPETWILVIFWALCAVAGAVIAPRRGHKESYGFVVGLFLGPLGLIILFLTSGNQPTPAELERQRQWDEWNRWNQWQQSQQQNQQPPRQ